MQVDCFILVRQITLRIISDQPGGLGHQRGVIHEAAFWLHCVEGSRGLVPFAQTAHFWPVHALRQRGAEHCARVSS